MNRRKMTMKESIKFNMLMDKMKITNKDIYRTILEDFLDSEIPFEMLCTNPNLILIK